MTRAGTTDVEQLAAATGLTHQQADRILDMAYMHIVCEQAQDVSDLGALLKEELAGAGIDRSDDEWDALALGAASVLGAAGGAR